MLWTDFEEALAHPSTKEFEMIDDALNVSPTWVRKIIDESFGEWVEDMCFTGSTPLNKDHPYNKYLRPTNAYLTFNYTETLETVYGFNDVLHIHGRSVFHGRETKERIVYGHKKIKTKNRYVNITEKNVKGIMVFHDPWFKRISNIIDGSIVVIGFSCNEVDQPYLKRIHQMLPNNSWHFFFHTDDDRKRIIKCASNIGVSKDKYTLEQA